jgi:hypothetical protein
MPHGRAPHGLTIVAWGGGQTLADRHAVPSAPGAVPPPLGNNKKGSSAFAEDPSTTGDGLRTWSQA